MGGLSSSQGNTTPHVACVTPITVFYDLVDNSNQFIRDGTFSINEHRIYPISDAVTELCKGVVIILHGGFWRSMYTVDNALIDTLQPFLSSREYAVCTVEYRRVGHIGGGWPGTNKDVLAAMKCLHSHCEKNPQLKISFDNAIILGHSAGGTLALWSCCFPGLDSLPFTPSLCIALAPIGDLEEGYRRSLGTDGKAVHNYLGCPPLKVDDAFSSSSARGSEDQPKYQCPYESASPHRLLPLRVPTLLVSGTNDDIVLPDLVAAFYAQAIAARNHAVAKGSSIVNEVGAHEYEVDAVATIQLLELSNCDHFQMVQASDSAWISVWASAERMIEDHRSTHTIVSNR